MFAKRRERLLAALEADSAAILLGAGRVRRSNDTDYPFRQDSDFHYLTGFDHPNAAAVLRRGGGERYTLFVEPRDRTAEIWTGSRPGTEGATRDYGADAAFPCHELPKRLPDLLRGARKIYHVLGRDPGIDALLVDCAERARQRGREGQLPPEAIADPRALIHEMRLVKDPEEIAILRRAAAISCEAHAAAARAAQPGAREYELEAALHYAFRRRGAWGAAYDSIVAAGVNATVLHYCRNDQPLEPGQSVLVDAGCELEGYASDVTRVYPVGGRFAGPVRDVYEVVLAAQRAALAACGPGRTLDDVHQAALRPLVEGMLALGLLRGDVEGALGERLYRRYYMHRTSHWMGLDVHDVGAYWRAGAPRPLEAGMVYTVEPGLYVAADDTAAPPAYRGVGVRIEDDVVITPEGYENLTAGIPKDVEAVEAWTRQGERGSAGRPADGESETAR